MSERGTSRWRRRLFVSGVLFVGCAAGLVLWPATSRGPAFAGLVLIAALVEIAVWTSAIGLYQAYLKNEG